MSNAPTAVLFKVWLPPSYASARSSDRFEPPCAKATLSPNAAQGLFAHIA